MKQSSLNSLSLAPSGAIAHARTLVSTIRAIGAIAHVRTFVSTISAIGAIARPRAPDGASMHRHSFNPQSAGKTARGLFLTGSII